MDDNRDLVDTTIAQYEQYINPALAKLFRFMGLGTVEWSADGAILRDVDGKEYIDCLGGYGVFNLGHRHPAVVAAVKEQLDRLPLSSKIFFNRPMAELAEKLAAITPGDLQYSFFCNSGTEAVEGALKLACIHTGRRKIVSTWNAFHGKTIGALSATGRPVFRDPFSPLLADVQHVPFGDGAALRRVMDSETAAVIIEPIQGEGGIILPPDGYLQEVRAVCDEFGAVMICDEVQTGLGRTGKLFAVEHWGVTPDIMTLAKALGGGVMPVGAYIARPHLWERYIESPLLHTSTFGGNPLACAAANAAIAAIEQEGLVGRSQTEGEYLLDKLDAIRAKYPAVIAEIRGKGLMIGIEYTKEGVGGFMLSELINAGILVAYTLNNPKVMRLEPPLNISRELLDRVVAVIARATEQADEYIEDL